MKRKHRILSSLLAVAVIVTLLCTIHLSINGTNVPFTGVVAEYYQGLIDMGFPENYAYSLTNLHLLHPDWSFVPLNVTQTNSSYTWNYVIQKETETPTINLVSGLEAYRAYRHEKNTLLYDTGYYQPSTDAVMYFMDPRNFLNEADIFQFYNLTLGDAPSKEAVEAVLHGSFMENAILQNGKTYAEYLIEIGREIGIDAIYLAAKLRQEQGVNGTSPLISGNCGDKLWEFYSQQKQYTDGPDPSIVNPPTTGESEESLKSLNGFYNPFNIDAEGNGALAIYKNAMECARRGSTAMSEAWGGSPAWDTDWKGLYGGALYIKQKYIDRNQSTIYLQKFDVDGRSSNGNFKNQYMQNIAGALSEGRNFYRAFAANDALDTACQFLIPVYKGMPIAPCADPAKGECAAFAVSTKRFSTSAAITHPQDLCAQDQPIHHFLTMASGNELLLQGEFTHSYGVLGLEYSIDGGNWISCSESENLTLQIPQSLLNHGEHLLLIRGEAAYDVNDSAKRLNCYFLCAIIQVNILPPPERTLTLQVGNVTSDTNYYDGDVVTLPVCDDPSFAGWIGTDGSVLPSGGTAIIRADVKYTALFVNYQALEGAAISLNEEVPHLRFYATIPEAQVEALGEHVTFMAQTTCKGITSPATIQSTQTVTGNSGTVWRIIAADTAPIPLAQRAQPTNASFSLQIHYSDGTTKTISAIDSTSPRSIASVAQAALLDSPSPYSPQTIGYLQSILITERTPIS